MTTSPISTEAQFTGELVGSRCETFELAVEAATEMFEAPARAAAKWFECNRRFSAAGDPWSAALALGFSGAALALARRFEDGHDALAEAAFAMRGFGDHSHAAVFRSFDAAARMSSGRGADARHALESAQEASVHVPGQRRVDEPIQLVRRALRGEPLFEPTTTNGIIVRRLLIARRRHFGRELQVHVEGRWFVAPGGQRVPCGHRPLLRRILTALAFHRIEQPGASLSMAELVRAGWPSERMTEESARNRVYVALSRLRELGLRGLLITRDDGWALRTDVQVSLVDDRPTAAFLT